MSWTLDGKIRIHARLSNTSYMRLHSWTSVGLRRLYVGQFLSHCDLCFVLFSFRTNLWPHLLTKNTKKAFIHLTRINCLVTTLFEVFNRLEAFLFFPFLGNQRGTQKKTHFALFGSRSEHRFSCSLAGPTTTYK